MVENGGEKMDDVELTRRFNVNVDKFRGIRKVSYNVVDIITVILDGPRRCFGAGLLECGIVFHFKVKRRGTAGASLSRLGIRSGLV